MSTHTPTVQAPNYVASESLRVSHAENLVVLIVADQEEARTQLTQVLELSGYQVMGTDNGQDAVKRARYIYPDLLLVDLNVPLLYQITAARQIVKKAGLRSLPVVIATHDDVVDTAAIMELGVQRNEYITRVSDFQQLELLLDHLLTERPRAA